MKKFLNLFFVIVLVFSFSVSVNAETGNYSSFKTTYCFKKDGTFAREVNAKDTSCSGLYSGTVYKQINGSDAYCVQGNATLSYSNTCKATSYNQYGWMNGNWNESNAVKTGYLIQYISGKKYSKAKEYVSIVNGLQNMLRFDYSFAKRDLNSDITAAINYATKKVGTYKKVSTKNPISATFNSKTLTNVNNKYAKGEINISLTNGSYDAKMTVTGKCNGCTLYTDSNLSKVYNGTTLKAQEKKSMTLYVRTGDYVENKDISVTFTAKYDKINYPVGKVWDCGSNKQALLTLSSVSYQIPSATVTTISKVPAIKRTCEIYNNNYYGPNGNVISKDEYIEQCEKPICKIVDNNYYGPNGKKITKEEYTEQCEKPICKIVDNNYYGANGKKVTKEEYTEQCEKPICKIVDNNYYGLSGKIVTKEDYTEQCEKPICKIVDNNYYGPNGKKVTKEEYTEQCEKPVCKIVDNNYYGSNGKKITKEEYIEQCEKPVCKVVDNNYYGLDGKKITKEEYTEQCEKPICKIVDGKYYGEIGKEVTKVEYEDQCSCRVVNDIYYGSNGIIVNREDYARQCEPSVVIDVPSTGTRSSSYPIIFGLMFIIAGVGSVIFAKKKING